MLRDLGYLLSPSFDGGYTFLTPTAYNVNSGTVWCGCTFIVPRTGTITKVFFRTGSVTSPLLTLAAKICQLNSSGMPLGTDIATSSTTVVNPSANTTYSVDISASVTKGDLIGVRVYPSAYTSGSANVLWSGSYSSEIQAGYSDPCVASISRGAAARGAGFGAFGLKYSDGWYRAAGLQPHLESGATLSSNASSGAVIGNKFVLPRPARICGYVYTNTAKPTGSETFSIGLFTGSDNTFLSASDVVYPALNSSWVGSGCSFLPIVPLIIPAGAYRVGLKASSSTAVPVRGLTGLPEAGVAGAIVDNLGTSVHKTEYYSGAWTDDTMGLCAVFPVFDMLDDGLPNPSHFLGVP